MGRVPVTFTACPGLGMEPQVRKLNLDPPTSIQITERAVPLYH
jgi:hypothetical protein